MKKITASRQRIQQWLLDIVPASTGITASEQTRVVLGAALGIFITAFFSQWVATDTVDHFWHGASLGATAFLIFTLPSSPFSQPWAVVAGNMLAVAIGMACAALIDSTILAVTLGVALTIFAMMQLRAVHPPGASLVMYVVLQKLHDPALLLFPFLFNLLLLVIIGIIYNRATGRHYPHRQVTSPAKAAKGSVSNTDIDKALARYNEVLAISREDLKELFHEAQGAAFQRHLGDMKCADIMTQQVHSVPAELALADIWPILHQSKNRMLPVTDGEQRLLGMIGLDQWLDAIHQREESRKEPQAEQLALQLSKRFKSMVRLGKKPAKPAEAPLLVRNAMVPTVVVAKADQPVMEIIPLLCQGGLYHVPITDEAHKLIGIISQTDLLRALNTALPQP